MRLIGMMDSPYVRRVAITMNVMDLPYTHEAISVFREYDRFKAVNSVVKAPTVVTDGGVTLMESTLILDYLDRLGPRDRPLAPESLEDYARAQRIIGLALAACDKTAAIVYELELRPGDKQHRPWIKRLEGQLQAAFGLLERDFVTRGPWLFGSHPLQADITAAVAWRFSGAIAPGDRRDSRPSEADGLLRTRREPAGLSRRAVRLSGAQLFLASIGSRILPSVCGFTSPVTLVPLT